MTLIEKYLANEFGNDIADNTMSFVFDGEFCEEFCSFLTKFERFSQVYDSSYLCDPRVLTLLNVRRGGVILMYYQFKGSSNFSFPNFCSSVLVSFGLFLRPCVIISSEL